MPRNIQVSKNGDKVEIAIFNISREFSMASVEDYDDLNLLKKIRQEYNSWELFEGLNSTNSSAEYDMHFIDFKADECSLNSVDPMVVRCMAKSDSVGILIESPVVCTVSAFGVDISNKTLKISLSIPR